MSDIVLDSWELERPEAAPDAGDLGRRVFGYALTVTAVAVALFGAAVGIALGLQHLPTLTLPARAPVAPPPAWREIVKPVHIYDFSAPGLADAPQTYAARRHFPEGGREDVLTRGTLDGEKLALRLRIFRSAGEPAVDKPLFADLAHEAAQAGLSIAHAGLPDVLPTRFGRFEVSDVTLARPGATPVPCGGFRLVLVHPAMAITGLACGAAKAPLTRPALACLLERLDVAAARDDRELVDFFAASELRRDAGCSGARLGPDGLHAPWLDDKPKPVPLAAPNPASAPAPINVGRSATSRKSLRRR